MRILNKIYQNKLLNLNKLFLMMEFIIMVMLKKIKI